MQYSRHVFGCCSQVTGYWEPGVPIVLSGAMTPLGFEGRDGLQNLTESLLAVQFLPPGIYVAMHGHVYLADHVSKDHSLGRFVTTP